LVWVRELNSSGSEQGSVIGCREYGEQVTLSEFSSKELMNIMNSQSGYSFPFDSFLFYAILRRFLLTAPDNFPDKVGFPFNAGYGSSSCSA
jgi:hypothetical protein